MLFATVSDVTTTCHSAAEGGGGAVEVPEGRLACRKSHETSMRDSA